MKASSLLLLILLSSTTYGDGPIDIKGNWEGTCNPTTIRNRSVSVCNICPCEYNATENTILISMIQLRIDDTHIVISGHQKEEKVSYKYKRNTLKFNFQSRDYAFKVKRDGDRILLVNDDGLTVTLTSMDTE